MVDTERLRRELDKFVSNTHIVSTNTDNPCTVGEYMALVNATKSLAKAIIEELEKE